MADNRKVDDKLYRVFIKKDSHINTKTNPDGSKAAMQFTNDGNELAGPLDIIEVDECELVRTEYVEYDRPRTFQKIIIEDVIVPVAREALYRALITGYDKLCQQLKFKAIPKLKQKSVNLMGNVKIIASGVKDGITGKDPKAIQLLKEYEKTEERKQEKVVRSEDEVIDIIRVMEMSAITLAACIRMLNNTVIADDGKNPEKRIEIQKNMQALTTADVMSQIELLLEDKNRDLLDEASISLLSAFKEGYFVVDDRRIPIAIYID